MGFVFIYMAMGFKPIAMDNKTLCLYVKQKR